MKVTISPEAQNQSLKLPMSVRIRVQEVVERLEKWPHISGVKWLAADWKGFARIRTGDYRVSSVWPAAAPLKWCGSPTAVMHTPTKETST